ncbi:pyruvate formate lyase-activating protein [Xylanibacillus composti]|uniref:Pyruvate formate-lyase-activating enzyme n=1 Tax=Xylanibacillus composti TaxID=1572762 RepID=A0A8J4H0A7_9BACL|nr:pyruvate formate-lyase-activating protein [Xylanibacillus composti]MDT9723460.1 pyruvate formate lyase-activating protein [Xylanibacillus composti]GIQ68504.1 pyruvate formate-lyase-activating enzyme [Xylanibacillus composti]
MIGHIHSMETFGTVDGPGIRFVLFMQGCALQCRYCHNPDTWSKTGGQSMTVQEVLAEIEPYLAYYKLSGGGLTVSGGEPTLQAAFVAELFRQAKERWDLHTALDTSGYCEPELARDLLAHTDLVLLDVKQMDREKHRQLTSQSHDRIFRFAQELKASRKSVWIRHVLVPGWTDEEQHLRLLGQFIERMEIVEKVEVLPYHRMGVYKWKQLGLPYTLEDVEPPAEEDIERACRFISRGRDEAGDPQDPKCRKNKCE